MSAPTRRLALLVWGALLATPLLFAGVTGVASPPRDMRSPELSGMFFWMAAAVVGLGMALSRVLPPRIRPRAQGSRDSVAFTRLLVAWAILEGASMFALVARMVTGDPLLYVPFALGFLAQAALFPSEARWAGFAVQPLPAGGARRMVR